VAFVFKVLVCNLVVLFVPGFGSILAAKAVDTLAGAFNSENRGSAEGGSDCNEILWGCGGLNTAVVAEGAA